MKSLIYTDLLASIGSPELEDLFFDGDQHLDYCGKFFAMNTDTLTMFALLEMAGSNHSQYIPDILYIYNTATELSCGKKNFLLMDYGANLVRSKKPFSALKKPILNQENNEQKQNASTIIFTNGDLVQEKNNTTKFIPACCSTQELRNCIDQIENDYILLTRPDKVFIEPSLIQQAIKELNKTGAYAFFLSNPPLDLPIPINKLTETVSAWCFFYAQERYKNHNSIDCVLYRKKDLIDFLKNCSADQPFLPTWQRAPIDSKKIGLCFH